jgi:hypothetical protein
MNGESWGNEREMRETATGDPLLAWKEERLKQHQTLKVQKVDLSTAIDAFDQSLFMLTFLEAYAVVRAFWMIILLIFNRVDRLIDLFLTLDEHQDKLSPVEQPAELSPFEQSTGKVKWTMRVDI